MDENGEHVKIPEIQIKWPSNFSRSSRLDHLLPKQEHEKISEIRVGIDNIEKGQELIHFIHQPLNDTGGWRQICRHHRQICILGYYFGKEFLPLQGKPNGNITWGIVLYEQHENPYRQP